MLLLFCVIINLIEGQGPQEPLSEIYKRYIANFTKYTCARSTFICFLMILTQGIGQTIYQQAVRLIEVGQ